MHCKNIGVKLLGLFYRRLYLTLYKNKISKKQETSLLFFYRSKFYLNYEGKFYPPLIYIFKKQD